jgi:hypothetical protein
MGIVFLPHFYFLLKSTTNNQKGKGFNRLISVNKHELIQFLFLIIKRKSIFFNR